MGWSKCVCDCDLWLCTLYTVQCVQIDTFQAEAKKKRKILKQAA